MRLQVYKHYLLWSLKYTNDPYFRLFRSSRHPFGNLDQQASGNLQAGQGMPGSVGRGSKDPTFEISDPESLSRYRSWIQKSQALLGTFTFHPISKLTWKWKRPLITLDYRFCRSRVVLESASAC